MFDGLDFSKMGDVLADLQKKAQELQTQTENQEFSVKSGGGMVQIKLNGKGEVLDVLIDESLMNDKESLQILLISAMNDAIKLVENERKNITSKMLGDFGGLGNFGNFGGKV